MLLKRIWLLLMMAVFGYPPATGWGQEPPQRLEIVQFISELNDASFAVRENACRQLLKVGVAAIPHLREASASSNLETSHRARQLLKKLSEIEHKMVLDAFQRDPSRRPGVNLQGWKELREIAGDTEQTRKLMVEMHRNEASLFQQWKEVNREVAGREQRAQQMAQSYEQRCNEIKLISVSKGQRNVEISSVATLLLLGGLPESAGSSRAASVLTNLLHFSNVRAALNDKKKSQALRPLLSFWIQKAGTLQESYQKLLLAMRYNIPEGRRPAIRLLAEGANGSQIQYAILALGKLGTERDVRLLKPLFANQAVLSQATSRSKTIYYCKVCDVALAAAIYMTGQDTADYNFERLAMNPIYLYAPNSAGFASEESRAAAFRKWDEWAIANSAKQPDK